MNTYYIKLLALLGLIIAFSATPFIAQANNTSIQLSAPHTANIGQIIRIRVLVSSDTSLNVIQGTVQYPKGLLNVTSVATGNSVLKYWQQQPNNDPGTGIISFTGGLPTPGFMGTGGTLFDITARALAEGKADITVGEGTLVLANDGNGSVLSSTKQGTSIQISKGATTPVVPVPETVRDTSPPSDLELVIGHDGNLFNGDWFAAFQGSDVTSGIDYYEVAEAAPNTAYPTGNEWVKAVSPYRLQEQEKNTKIFLKAVDKSGNESVISRDHIVKPPIFQTITAPTDWRLLIILAIILLIAIVVPIFVYHRKKQQVDTVQS